MGRAKTVLLYGESGNTKTTQCVHIARYIYKKYGKITRLISSDGGGWAPVEDENLLISKDNPIGNGGIVEAFNMTNRKKYLSEWRKLAQGYWPKVVEEDGKKVRRFVMTSQEEWKKIGWP